MEHFIDKLKKAGYDIDGVEAFVKAMRFSIDDAIDLSEAENKIFSVDKKYYIQIEITFDRIIHIIEGKKITVLGFKDNKEKFRQSFKFDRNLDEKLTKINISESNTFIIVPYEKKDQNNYSV